MRRLVLFLFASIGAVSAQEASPLGLTNAVAFAWDDVHHLVAAPDSGRVEDGAGHLAWFDVDPEVSRLDVLVVRGTIDQVTMTTGSDEGRARLAEVIRQYKTALGPPGDGAFYTASQLRASNPDAPYIDIAFLAETGQTIMRKPYAPPPAGPPPPRR